MKFWVVKIETAKGVRYGTYNGADSFEASAKALRSYPNAYCATTIREEGARERQVRETFGRMYGAYIT